VDPGETGYEKQPITEHLGQPVLTWCQRNALDLVRAGLVLSGKPLNLDLVSIYTEGSTLTPSIIIS